MRCSISLKVWVSRIVWALAAISAVAALIAVTVFETLSDKRARTAAIRSLWAHLYAIRLYADDPGVVLPSFAGLISANARLLFSMATPVIAMAALFFVSYGYLDTLFGSVTLSPGVARVLTVQLNHLDENGWPPIRLDAPAWIVVDAPPVHVFDSRQISWRIQATKASRGTIQIQSDGESVRKVIDSRSGLEFFAPVRTQSWMRWLRYPAERPLPAGNIEEISLFDPSTSNWAEWFTLFMLAFALPVKWLVDRMTKIGGR